ncbi:transmembrane protein 145-like [Saccostrea echinata]|uniref:transmembrane protein 145-like n=1 Tax=Saccostrea echinata TaxID=191078 RepID=UPI002A82EC23|nr:transmembrane protein 145-like [Saccostrea echinata]
MADTVFNLTIVVLFYVAVSWNGVLALRVDGSILTSEDWVFLSRFCYMSKNGELDYYIQFPQSYEIQHLLFYYDRPTIWESVYPSSKTCEQKKAVLDISRGQILPLNPLNSYSGCKYITISGVQYVECQDKQRFSSSRDMWWYLVLSRCPSDRKDNTITGLNITFRFHMTNGDDLWHREFSADELYILPTDIAFLILYFFITLISMVFAIILRSRQMFHVTYKIYLASLCLWWFHLLLWCIAYGRYSAYGYKETGTERAARIFAALSSLLFMLMLLLMADGYTIIKGKMAARTSILFSVFFTVYVIAYAALYIVEANTFDPGTVLYIYEYWPGYALIALRLLAWIFFVVYLFMTLKKHRKNGKFYYPLFIIYTIWFWAGPIAIIIGMFAIRQWAREKIVNGVDQLIMMLGHVTFLILTRPSAANENFPYTIKTSQIGLISEDDLERPTNYEISEEELQEKTGPNLNDIFTVSQTRKEPSAPQERPSSRTRLSRPSREDRPSSRTPLTNSTNQESEGSASPAESDNDSLPPPYSSVTSRERSVPSSLPPLNHFVTSDSTQGTQRNALSMLPMEERLGRPNALPPIKPR